MKSESNEQKYVSASEAQPVEQIKSFPATETTRPYEETICEYCDVPIWRCTDEPGLKSGWMHRDIPSNPCKAKPARVTYATPKLEAQREEEPVGIPDFEDIWERYSQIIETIECDMRGEESLMKRKDFLLACADLLKLVSTPAPRDMPTGEDRVETFQSSLEILRSVSHDDLDDQYLEPCPYCGGKQIYDRSRPRNERTIICTKCSSDMPEPLVSGQSFEEWWAGFNRNLLRTGSRWHHIAQQAWNAAKGVK